MKQSIPQSKITSVTAAYVYGKAVGDPFSLIKMDSKELVSSLFGITTTDPVAIDITEAIIKNLSNDEQVQIRKILYDRNICGIIWKFVTTKRFLVEMSKIPDGYHHNIQLSLVMPSPSNPTEETIIKALVTFGRNGVSFNKSNEYVIDYDHNSIEELNRLHDESVANLDDKYLKTAEEGGEMKSVKPVTLPGMKVVTVTEQNESLVITNSLSGQKLLILKGKYFCDNIPNRGNTVVYNETEFVLGKDTDEELLSKFLSAIEENTEQNEEVVTEKEPEAVNESPQETVPEKCDDENMLIASEGTLIRIDDVEDNVSTSTLIVYKLEGDVPTKLGYLKTSEKENLDLLGDYKTKSSIYKKDLSCTLEEFVSLLERCSIEEPPETPSQESTKTHEVLHPQPPPPEEKPTDEEKKTDGVVEKTLSSSGSIVFNFRKGDIVTFSKVESDDGTICRIEGDTSSIEITDPNFDEGFIFGKYRAKEDISEAVAAEYEQLHEFMELFELVESQTTVKVDDIRSDMVDIDDEESQEPVQKENEEMQSEQPPSDKNPWDIQIVNEKLHNIASELVMSLNEILDINPSQTDEELTTALRAATDIDDIKVVHSDRPGWDITIADPKPPAEPEVQSIDIFNMKNQYALLRGLFGTANPAITHVEKFLKDYLTSEKNLAFLSTGTFPTETTISYTEKPYDVTYSIVKFKDGRFYRIFAAITDKKLNSQGYIETKHIEGRWVKLIDVQNSAYRQDGRGRRF